jgi:lysophospholipase L1-like esterase
MRMMTVKLLSGRRTARLTVLLGLLTAASIVLGSAPASADTTSGTHRYDNVIRYVALGDSYAYGVGANHEKQSYPALLDRQPGIVLTADRTSPGASTTNPTPGTIDVDEQIASAQKELWRADLVTLTVGGNDLGALQTLGICLTVPQNCASALDAVRQKLSSPEFSALLESSIRSVTTAASHATVVVTGYPLLFDPAPVQPVFPPELVATLNTLTNGLNSVISQAVDRVGGRTVFVDVRDEFLGHGLGSAHPWILGEGPNIFHPTAAGYRFGYFAAIAETVDLRALGQQCAWQHAYQDAA